MDPNQRLVNFPTFKVTEYLKSLLTSQTAISHDDIEVHIAAYNSLLNAESTPTVIDRLKSEFKTDLENTVRAELSVTLEAELRTKIEAELKADKSSVN